MKIELISKICCPISGKRLLLKDINYNIIDLNNHNTKDFIEGYLCTEDGKFNYPIVNSIPRFVSHSNYADNFGMQWNYFSKTQLDSFSGHPISAERFWKSTNWEPKILNGSWVLDVGCGSGRFAEVALSAGAKVVALDYSSAVDACYSNLSHHPNLHVVQANIYELPFLLNSFSFVYSLGVLQHTPNVANAFEALPPLVSEGGHICVDIYEKSLYTFFLPKYWLRPITKNLNKDFLFSSLKKSLPFLLFVSSFLNKIPFVGKYLMRLVPVANYEGVLPLTKNQIKEWALLDTFDWLSPAFDNPQSSRTLHTWLVKAGLKNIEILSIGHLVGRGVK